MRWDGALYAANTGHHRAFDRAFLGPVEMRPGWHVLDLGCGVGDLTESLAGLVPDGIAVGLDAAPSMIATARGRRASNLEFVVGRAQEAARVAARWAPFDLVVSTAMLHWVPGPDHVAVLREVRALLGPGGLLRAEFGGRGQIRRAMAILDAESARLGGTTSPWYFPGAEEYRRRLEGAGFSQERGFVRLRRQRRALPDPEALVGWLRSQVEIAYEPGLPQAARNEFRRRVEERALAELRRPDGTYDQDYVRLDLMARSP